MVASGNAVEVGCHEANVDCSAPNVVEVDCSETSLADAGCSETNVVFDCSETNVVDAGCSGTNVDDAGATVVTIREEKDLMFVKVQSQN